MIFCSNIFFEIGHTLKPNLAWSHWPGLAWPHIWLCLKNWSGLKFGLYIKIRPQIYFYIFFTYSHSPSHLVVLVFYSDSLLKVKVTIQNIVLTMYIYDYRSVQLYILIDFYSVCFNS